MLKNEIKSKELKRLHQAKRSCMIEEKSPENWSTQHLPYSDKLISDLSEEKRIDNILGG